MGLFHYKTCFRLRQDRRHVFGGTKTPEPRSAVPQVFTGFQVCKLGKIRSALTQNGRVFPNRLTHNTVHFLREAQHLKAIMLHIFCRILRDVREIPSPKKPAQCLNGRSGVHSGAIWDINGQPQHTERREVALPGQEIGHSARRLT
jgi:hypothetical protein